jgi:hypothetical protein
VAVPGFDSAAIHGTNAPGLNLLGSTNGVVSYRLGSPAAASADLDVTLAWDRHTFWSDVNGNGRIDAADTFFVNTSTDAPAILILTRKRRWVVATSRSMSTRSRALLRIHALRLVLRTPPRSSK